MGPMSLIHWNLFDNTGSDPPHMIDLINCSLHFFCSNHSMGPIMFLMSHWYTSIFDGLVLINSNFDTKQIVFLKVKLRRMSENQQWRMTSVSRMKPGRTSCWIKPLLSQKKMRKRTRRRNFWDRQLLCPWKIENYPWSYCWSLLLADEMFSRLWWCKSFNTDHKLLIEFKMKGGFDSFFFHQRWIWLFNLF